ncbi:hypothetical protein [Novosphingobium album (ex Liu et al. 2023)]|uniref:Uncharacterized protein n=1 Tax=Novosphingobium album (ex Liu et al. 2023) TaxID=3031130 RepID=A0ABT5WRV8_9SPHN|nr:hypothetical protein [Novosphingobium album (ex Liu et al. 2023)]MDE8652765.1 hypothetical protein [Novosphingobium album (ex Liu et al. 2023)]
MMHFTERALSEELLQAKALLDRALAILDLQAEDEAAYWVCTAIERLIGAPRTLEQWYMMTGRNPDGSSSR